MTNSIRIELLPSDLAPRYTLGECSELRVEKCVITERGAEAGLPIVDFQLTDGEGNKYFVAMTGRILTSIAAAVKGVNLRNHGTEEP